MYTAHILSDLSRAELMSKYTPKYTKFIGHHVTIEFGVGADTTVPEPADIKVVGYIDSGDGLEALVVSVDGTYDKPNGLYHITWSLDPDKYSPKDSNDLLNNKRFDMSLPIPITTTPMLCK